MLCLWRSNLFESKTPRLYLRLMLCGRACRRSAVGKSCRGTSPHDRGGGTVGPRWDRRGDLSGDLGPLNQSEGVIKLCYQSGIYIIITQNIQIIPHVRLNNNRLLLLYYIAVQLNHLSHFFYLQHEDSKSSPNKSPHLWLTHFFKFLLIFDSILFSKSPSSVLLEG